MKPHFVNKEHLLLVWGESNTQLAIMSRHKGCS